MTTTGARRWLHLGAVAWTAVHHGFELAAGVGLVFQPYLGLGGALAAWGVALPSWAGLVLLARRRAARPAAGDDDDTVGRAADAALAVLAGVAIAGVLVHFRLWPFERRPAGRLLGVPVLVEAEGLSRGQLPAYNAVLYAWGLSAAVALAAGTPRGSRRWALPGLFSAVPLAASARHHFAWARRQAVEHPAWWNRALH